MLNARSQERLKERAKLSAAADSLGRLLFDMCEHHADELNSKHGNDEPEKGIGKSCSYCRDMVEAAGVLIELTGLDEFTYPDNWPEGVQLGNLKSV